jgi:di/tricarboxylate transporter
MVQCASWSHFHYQLQVSYKQNSVAQSFTHAANRRGSSAQHSDSINTLPSCYTKHFIVCDLTFWLACVLTPLVVLQSVEWDMLLFFAAQFVMVEAAAEVGMIDMIGGWLEYIIRAAPAASRTLVAVEILLWASAAISGVLVRCCSHI